MTTWADQQRWELLLDTGRTEQALADISVRLAASPGDDMAMLYAARAHLELGRFAACERQVRAVLAVDPGREWALRLLAAALSGLDRKAEAVTVADTAVRHRPDLPQTWQNLAAMLSNADRPLGALGVAKRAVELDPEDDELLILQASLHLKLRSRQRAIALVGVVLRRNPDHRQARELLARIDPRGGRWVIGRMTADLVADPATRVSLRSTAPPDLSSLTSRLPAGTLPPIRVRGSRVDDRPLTNALAAAGDPDVARTVRLRQRLWFLRAAVVQAAIGFFSRSDLIAPGPRQAAAIAVVAALALSAIALLRVAAPGRSGAWRRTELRQLLSPGSVLLLAVNLAAAVGALLTLIDDHPDGLAIAFAFGMAGFALGIGSITHAEMRDYAAVMPSGRVLVAGFVGHRHLLTVALAAPGIALGIAALLPEGSDSVAVRAGLLAAVVGLGVLSARFPVRTTPAIAAATRMLRADAMKRITRWSIGLGAVTGVAVVLGGGSPFLAFIGLIGSCWLLISLWAAGPVNYLPGMDPTIRRRAE